MSMSMTELEGALRALRLSGMIATLQARALQVAHHQTDFIEAFASLVQDELDRRRSRKMAYGLRVLAILGQVLRNYYGSLRAERKEKIANTGYALLGRMLRVQMETFVNHRDSFVTMITEALEKGGLRSGDGARSTAGKLVFGLASLIVFFNVKRASEFLGSDKLLPTHQLLSGAVDTPLSRLLGIAVALDYPSTGSSGEPRAVPLSVLKDFDEEIGSNSCAGWILRRLVIDYLHMFEVSYRDRQKICDALRIPMKTQRRIQLTSQRKPCRANRR